MKRLKVLSIVLVVCCLVLLGCAPAVEPQPSIDEASSDKDDSEEVSEPAMDEEIVIGYIQAGPDVYYTREVDGVRYIVEDVYGHELVVLNSEYNQEKELANADDLIAQDVDAIILMTTNADAAQKVAQKCNEANIPLFLSGWEMSPGPGKATATLLIDQIAIGNMVADYVVENLPDSKCYVIGGVPGQGLGDPFVAGFEQGVDGTGIEILDIQYGMYDRKTAMDVAQDMLAANPNVQFIYVVNEDMAMGVWNVLDDMGLAEDVALVSANGGPTGVEMLNNGQLAFTVAWSPTRCGTILGNISLAYVKGEGIEDVPVALKPITVENIDELDPWDLTELLAKYDGDVPIKD